MKTHSTAIGNMLHLCLCHYRNGVCPVMSSFPEMIQLTSFRIYKSMCIINSKYSCACLVCRKVIGPKSYLPDCSLWQCNVCSLSTKWLSSRCLLVLQRNENDLHAPLKAAGLSFNFGNWLQVVMSVSRCMLQRNVWPLVVWFNILVTIIFQTWYIRWPTKWWIW